jgi:hypothetical protein
MHDEASTDRSARRSSGAGLSPESVVLRLYASLRGTATLVGLLVDRIDMAYAPGAQVDRVPADVPAEVLVRLTAVSDALREASDAALCHLDPRLARRAWAAADMASQATPGGDSGDSGG